ncbi:MAG: metallophosphoesterase family protein [Caldilineales bacterium]|nr:metallophosphoesterase family protein [Caldilineales bacterium]
MTKIAIFSDSHDNIWNLDKALGQARSLGAEALVHCGDLCSPFVIRQLAEGFTGPIHLVFGNNDGDGRLIQTVASEFAHVKHHGFYAEIWIASRHIALIHYPEPALRIAQSHQLDLVCYGHNHARQIRQVDDTWLVNPGELLGKDNPATWAMYDCTAHTCELITAA